MREQLLQDNPDPSMGYVMGRFFLDNDLAVTWCRNDDRKQHKPVLTVPCVQGSELVSLVDIVDRYPGIAETLILLRE